MSGAGAQERGSDSQSEPAGSSVRVQVENEVVQIVSMSGEMEELRHFSRSTTLMDMTAAAGTSALPITHSGIKLWQQAADSMLNTETWHLHRTLELSLIVQVSEYLNDKETLAWAIRRLAQAVDSAVRAKYRALYNQRDNGDASFWRQLLRPLEIGSGTRFAKFAATERHAVGLSRADTRLPEADHLLLSSCQALMHLPLILQTQALSLVQLPLCVLVPQLPPDLVPALLRRHLSHSALDMSNQLRLLEHDSRYTRSLCELVKKLPLERLTAELRTLRPLTSLNVSGNNLTAGDAAPLATCFESCASELQTLIMSRNTHLRFFEAVLPSLAACTALTCLDLSGCRLNESCAAPLGAVLCAARSLKRLILDDCITMPLETLTQHVAISLTLLGLAALTCLSIRENRFEAGFTALARVLRGLGALQELDVSGSAPHCDSLACVVASALQLPALHTLRLDHTAVSMQSSMGPSLTNPCSLVQNWFELYNVEVRKDHGVDGGRNRGGATTGSTSGCGDGSVQLHAGDACMEFEGSDCTPPDLKSMRCPLRELHIRCMHGVGIDWLMHVATAQMAWRSNRLRKVGRLLTPWQRAISPPLWEIVRAQEQGAPEDAPLGGPLKSPWSLVAMLENLEVLDISEPGYSFKYPFTGANSSCEFIFQLPKLRELRARNLDVKHRSFCLNELSEGLSHRVQQHSVVGLTALDWSENSVTVEDLRAVCSISTLQRLVIQGCGLGVEGATALAEHVSQLKVLHTLDLAGNKLTGAGVAALMHGASDLSSLKVVDVGGGSGVVQAVSELRSSGALGGGVHVSCTAHID